MVTKVVLPEMGEGVIEGTLSRWLVKPGDVIEKFAPIAEVETDKVTTETTAETGGTILELCVVEGETVPVGTVLAYIGEAGEAVPANGTERSSASIKQPATEVPTTLASPDIKAPAHERPHVAYTGRISPVVGRIAAEHQVDLGQLDGSGRDGRITKQDVLDYVARRADQPQVAPVAQPLQSPPETSTASPTVEPKPSAAVSDTDEVRPLTSIRRSIAEHMVMSKRTSPHVTTVFEFDFSSVSAHRRAHKDSFKADGVNLTFTAYIMAATIQALKAHPMVNSTWSEGGIVLHRAINIGMAAAIDEGLIVPVIKNADGLNLLGLARTINDLTHRARNKQLKPADVQGGTFSITNHGTSGSLFATPIINQPQAGILGVGMIEKRVKVIDDAIAIRPLAYVSFTFDHRILDGASADAFVNTIKDQIEDWR